MKRLLVTGSRHWYDRGVIERVLWDIYLESTQMNGEAPVLVSGACPTGADAICEELWAEYAGSDNIERHPADWDQYGRAAGPIRNSEMVDLGADLCLAFILHDSRGTRDCANKAEVAGIETRRYFA